ncbi:MAG TPA: hypothetical protein DEQ28_06490, partial [Clostridiales bacterium]|nr:hypothetical protein [Clostridiales bacterium]
AGAGLGSVFGAILASFVGFQAVFLFNTVFFVLGLGMALLLEEGRPSVRGRAAPRLTPMNVLRNATSSLVRDRGLVMLAIDMAVLMAMAGQPHDDGDVSARPDLAPRSPGLYQTGYRPCCLHGLVDGRQRHSPPALCANVSERAHSEERATVLSFPSLAGNLLFTGLGPLSGWVSDTYGMSWGLSSSSSFRAG